jgi:hypothetical protein
VVSWILQMKLFEHEYSRLPKYSLRVRIPLPALYTGLPSVSLLAFN